MNDLFTAESYLDGLTTAGVGLSEVLRTKVNVKTFNLIASKNMLDLIAMEYQFLGHPLDLGRSLDDDEVVITYYRGGVTVEVTIRLEDTS